jgi:hypothetical protein
VPVIPQLDRCPNCGSRLSGPWCSQCGQKRSSLDPTWHDLVHEALHEFLHLDGKIFRALRKLFFEPGELTAEHIRGRRAHYVGAIRLYLTMSLLFFALSAILPNPNPDDGRAARQERSTVELRPMPVARGWARVGQGLQVANEHPERINELLSHTFPRIMFILVPIFALLLKLAYRSRHRRYPQFLYFSLHFHAAVFAWLIFTVPLQMFSVEIWLTVAQVVVMVAAFGYLVVALRRVFGGATGETMWRASVVGMTYGITLLLTIVAAVVVSLYRLVGIE